MKYSIKQIASDIIKTVQNESNSFQYTIDYSEIEKKYGISIDYITKALIVNELNSRNEIADVELIVSGIDIVLYTDYAPNYQNYLRRKSII